MLTSAKCWCLSGGLYTRINRKAVQHLLCHSSRRRWLTWQCSCCNPFQGHTPPTLMQEICAYFCRTSDVHTPCLQKQLKQFMDCLTGLIEATVLDNPTTRNIAYSICWTIHNTVFTYIWSLLRQSQILCWLVISYDMCSQQLHQDCKPYLHAIPPSLRWHYAPAVHHHKRQSETEDRSFPWPWRWSNHRRRGCAAIPGLPSRTSGCWLMWTCKVSISCHMCIAWSDVMVWPYDMSEMQLQGFMSKGLGIMPD